VSDLWCTFNAKKAVYAPKATLSIENLDKRDSVAERSQFELAGDFVRLRTTATASRRSAQRKRDRASERSIPHNGCWHYFLALTFLPRAADPYRLLKHLRHRRSRRLMKLGARSSAPQ
jgi:hypothetical protein